MNKALLLDRDGVINEDGEYIFRPQDFHFIPGIFDLCQAAKSCGYKLIVATNQSGIARGYYTENDFLQLDKWMCVVFVHHGINIDRTYYCPFHPEKGIAQYKAESPDRKPQPGMFLRAKKDFDLDLRHSIAIGDRDSDMQAARVAGVETLLLLPGNYPWSAAADVHVINHLSEALTFLH